MGFLDNIRNFVGFAGPASSADPTSALARVNDANQAKKEAQQTEVVVLQDQIKQLQNKAASIQKDIKREQNKPLSEQSHALLNRLDADFADTGRKLLPLEASLARLTDTSGPSPRAEVPPTPREKVEARLTAAE